MPLSASFGMAPRIRRRSHRSRCSSYVVLLLLICLVQAAIAQNFNGVDSKRQGENNRQTQSPTASTASIPSPTSSTALVDATQTPFKLIESQVTEATLAIGSANPAQFYLTTPFKNSSNPLYITATLCDGPAIQPYDVNNSTLLHDLGMDYWTALTSTLPKMYVSTDERNTSPGPDNMQGDPDIAYFFGGLAQSQSKSQDDDGAWISIYPPDDARAVTGQWTLVISASTESAPLKLEPTQGLSFEDSDRSNALLTTYNASQGLSSNLTLAILPTEGEGSLHNAFYFNSSICAIANAFDIFNSSKNPDRLTYNRTGTMRGSAFDNTTRAQWYISDLQPNTNYTAWLFDVGSLATGNSISTTVMWPAIKFSTKQSPNCRLVYDVDFCPTVAYSIPVAPDVSTQRALAIINETVAPNFANFSATLDTFPCGSSDFGEYSPLQTCASCQRAYQDWLCAVTMPRCTDALSVVNNQTSAAVPDPFDLFGVSTPLNEQTLPYVINRRGNSRQPYIDAPNALNAGSYGEVLPCIYTCYAVASACPQPLIQWYCPIWDITAQSQYGTFADSGALGLGGGENGGAGGDGQRWGGLTRFIAQDNFGNVYCNSMNVERSLLRTNSAKPRSTKTVAVSFIVGTLCALFMTVVLIP